MKNGSVCPFTVLMAAERVSKAPVPLSLDMLTVALARRWLLRLKNANEVR